MVPVFDFLKIRQSEHNPQDRTGQCDFVSTDSTSHSDCP